MTTIQFIRWGIALALLFPGISKAQTSLTQVESQLADYASSFLVDTTLQHKIAQNKQFSSLLLKTLNRPESYEYDWKGLESISVLKPEDNSFRIFTWFLVDKKLDQYYGPEYNYHFGVVQRRYEDPETGKIEYIVIPLFEMSEVPRGVDNMLLDNNQWMGALYYLPKGEEHLPKYRLKYLSPKRKRPNGKQIKIKQDFYLLMGWSGNDEKSNLKMVEVMSFDPEQKDRVVFGADVFYFDQIPKYRAIFQYSEYAPFSLNYNWVLDKPFGKKQMIVYDHMGTPKSGEQKLKEIWETGPDGSYDALYFYKRGGYFEWYRNIELAERYISKQYRKEQESIRKNQETVADRRYEGVMSDSTAQQMMGLEKGRRSYRAERRAEKAMLKELEEQKKREEARLREAGIDPDGE
ncbi:MAG: hypothetical protein AAFQ87_09070 [Bacteroidota bacterium]